MEHSLFKEENRKINFVVSADWVVPILNRNTQISEPHNTHPVFLFLFKVYIIGSKWTTVVPPGRVCSVWSSDLCCQEETELTSRCAYSTCIDSQPRVLDSLGAWKWIYSTRCSWFYFCWHYNTIHPLQFLTKQLECQRGVITASLDTWY